MGRALDFAALWTMQQTADFLGVSMKVLRKHVADGRLAFIDVGRGLERSSKRIMPADATRLRDELNPLYASIEVRHRLVAEQRQAAADAAGEWLGFVYFIRRADFVKIGFSTDPDARLRQIRMNTPDKLELLLAVPGTMKDERRLHADLKRMRHQGEWFHDGPDVAAAIHKCRIAGVVP